MSKCASLLASVCVLVATAVQSPSTQAEPTMDALLKLYLSYSLPVPPPDSELVLLPLGLRNSDGTNYYTAAFAHRLKDGSTRYYFGTRQKVLPRQGEVRFTTIAKAPGPLMLHVPNYGETWIQLYFIHEDVAIALSMQAEALGMHKQAKELVDYVSRGLYMGSGGLVDPYRVPQDATNEERIAYLALHAAMNDWGLPGSNPKQILARVQHALASGIMSDEPYRLEDLDRDIDGLRRASVPLPKPRNEIQACVTSLAAISGPAAAHLRNVDPCASLIVLGDKALPILADYLGDKRLTRYCRFAFGNAGSQYLTLDDMVSLVIREIIKDPLFEKEWFQRPSRAAVYGYLDWKKTGDRNAFLKGLMLPESVAPRDAWPDVYSHRGAGQEMLENDLAQFEATYLEMAFHHAQVMGQLHYVLSSSELPIETKRRLGLSAARSPILYHAVDGLDLAFDAADELSHEVLREQVAKIPFGRLNSGEGWAVCSLARLVARSGGEKDWDALKTVLPSVRPGTRAIALVNMVNTERRAPHPQERRMLALMNAFLDDDAAPQIENLGVQGHLLYWRDVDRSLSVGDCVAIELFEYFTGRYVEHDSYGPDTTKDVRQTVDSEMRKRGFTR